MKSRNRGFLLLALLLALCCLASAALADNLKIQVVYQGDEGKESLRVSPLSVTYYNGTANKTVATLKADNAFTAETADSIVDAEGQPQPITFVKVNTLIWPQYAVSGSRLEGDTLKVFLDYQDTFENFATPGIQLTAMKTVNGREPGDAQVFGFSLTGEGQNQQKNNANGRITFDPIYYSDGDAGKTFTYEIRETTQSTQTMLADPSVYTVQVKVEKTANGYTLTQTTLKDGQPHIGAIAFNNASAPYVDLSAVKTVNGQTPTPEQVYEFTLVGDEGTNQTRQNALGQITFDRIYYDLSDVGKTYTYQIREKTVSTDPAFITDPAIYEVEVKIVEDAGSYRVEKTVKSDGQPHTGAIAFNNADAPYVDITAIKTVDGQTPTDAQVFEFGLSSQPGQQTYAATARNAGELIAFPRIYYGFDDVDNVFHYIVRETTTSTDTMLSDPILYKVSVWVEEINGRYTAEAIYYREDHNVPAYGDVRPDPWSVTNEIRFNNLTPPSIQITASKTVNGKTPAADQKYTFTLENEPNTPDQFQEKENTLGEVLFDPISYTRADIGKFYSYRVRETTPSQGDLTTDATNYLVDVQIKLENGKAVAEMTNYREEGDNYDQVDALTFDNRLIIRTEFAVEKRWEDGRDDTIDLTLYANGVKMDPQPTYERQGNRYVYSGLRMFDDNDQLITYSATERFVDGYMTAYVNPAPYEDDRGFVYDGGTIINRPVTSITVRKIWKGISETAQKPEIELLLYNDGQLIDKQPRKGEDGLYSFINLPVHSTPYYVVETPIKGYATRYENQGKYEGETQAAYAGGTITNYLVPRTGDRGHAGEALGLMALSLAGIALILRKKGRL